MFNLGNFKELTEMKKDFNQMETEVAKCSVDRKYFEIEKKELIIENDRLLEDIICQDVMCKMQVHSKKCEKLTLNKALERKDICNRPLALGTTSDLPKLQYSRSGSLPVSAFVRWVDRLAPGTINTRDLPKKAFIQRYCPPSMTANQLEVIHNFKQEGDESLYQALERYNDMLYKCPTHDINSHQKVNIFYKGLSTMNRQLLDSQGPIAGMRPAEALTAIQTMTDHS
ncbi:hypothetical protein Tco_0511857 [Tanacetum coccineum]